MRRLTTTGTDLRPAPLAREERAEAVRAILTPHGIFARRTGHAATVGCTITYWHLSEAADGPRVTALLAEALGWAETDVADVAGTVAITTHRG